MELWGESCGICCETPDIYFVNPCDCKNLVCRDCSYKCCRTDPLGNHIRRCPYCRYESPVEKIYYWRHSEEKKRANRAASNWNYYFTQLNGMELLRPHLHPPLYNRDPIHRLLNTGRFCDHAEAGVCVDKWRAKLFVQNQLAKFAASVPR